MRTKYSEELLDKYLNGTADSRERAIIESWYTRQSALIADPSEEQDYSLINAELRKRLELERPKPKLLSANWFRLSAAATIAFAILGIWLFNPSNPLKKDEDMVFQSASDIAPGRLGATITLANGELIELKGDKEGVRIGEALTYSDGTVVADKLKSLSPGGKTEEAAELTASTSKGQTYQFTLPDGTRVWLNAASSIRFPASFSHAKTRVVELTGEAYFVVVHNDKQPFQVRSEGQLVEDIGTEFNINAYRNEGSIRSTLVEGSARVSQLDKTGLKVKTLTLKPNEQAVLSEENLEMKTVDISEAIAWKNGMFQFEQADIHTIMNQLSRWYGVEVVYEGTIPTDRYKGKVPRNVNLSQVFKILSASGVNFKIEGNKIIVK
ncbi:FecR domain-containing protein [Pedobacter sp. GR22-6]|uniref:FecR domain-containing protein n=1 Tax=Pedobacter sp. GR22-6 TaxID=3127957 RepID=UPI00307D4C89